MGLKEYQEKRNFKKTSEPAGKKKPSSKQLCFVVQKHAATRLHYDFRLELDGVLKSWAVPKGPSLNPDDKRLAMMVEDHPFDYKDFEGVIPEGNYGAGKVIIWDQGIFHSYETEDRKESEKILREGLEKGDLKFTLKGEKLNGNFALVKMKNKQDNSWLLIKKKDEYASTKDILESDRSVVSGKTVNEITEANSDPVKKKNRQPATVSRLSKEVIQKSSKKAMPHKVKPMLATLVDDPFDDPEWIFEIKWDGYRAIAEIENGNVELYSRNNLSFNQKFLSITKSLEKINHTAIFDGEIVVLDKSGRPDFQLIQNYQGTGAGYLVYYVFDILYLDGYDLHRLPLIKRKDLLKQVLPENGNIKYGDHIIESGKSFYKLAQENNLEGILAKRSNSTYLDGKRTKYWLKIKTKQRQEAIICGFTQPKGSRKNFGALVLGVYKDKELIYIGHAGGGFTEDKLDEIYSMLKPLVQKESPFKEKIKTNTPVTWLKPKLICEVEFSEWTGEGLLRQPVFIGLREDKNPESIVKEKAEQTSAVKKNSEDEKMKSGKDLAKDEVIINKQKIKLSNLDKIFWKEEKYTKGDLIDYYRKVAKYIIPYLKDRPESLYRTPNGIDAEGFFQKDVGELPPDWVKTEKIYSESNDKHINYLFCQDEATLVYLANLGCIEINPWFSRIQKLDNPDYLVIDLDPEQIAFEKVIDTALVVKEVLDIAGAKSFCKTSGATGIHIYVPLKAKYDYDTAKDFAHIIAKITHKKIPDFTSIERSPAKRQKKVYLDYLQNRSGQTLAAPYSVRPRPGAPVSTPLLWEEVKHGLSPLDFNIKNIHKRLDKMGDIFKGVLGAGIDIGKCLKNLQ